MKLTFEGAWADFRYRLKPRTTIQNWSILKGDTGGEFRIDHVDGASITIIPEGRKPRSISKADFERMYRLWPAYKTGSISRTPEFQPRLWSACSTLLPDRKFTQSGDGRGWSWVDGSARDCTRARRQYRSIESAGGRIGSTGHAARPRWPAPSVLSDVVSSRDNGQHYLTEFRATWRLSGARRSYRKRH